MSEHFAATTVRHSVVVNAPIEKAFKVFTEDFGRFKPPEHNLLGAPRRSSRPEWVALSTTVASMAANAAGRAFWPMNLPIGW